MFCHNCGIKLPEVGEVNFCPECGKEVINKVVNKLVKRGDYYYELGHDQPFTGKFISRYENGQIEKEAHYKNGFADGLYTAWHLSGYKESEGLYSIGRQEALWTWWNDCGQQIIEKYYKNGIKHGLWVDWHANGQKKVEGNFVHGKREGVVTIWNEDGVIISETLYKNDERVS